MAKINFKSKITELTTMSLVSIFIGSFINTILSGNINATIDHFGVVVVFSLCIGLPVWLINKSINIYISTKIGWEKNPTKALRVNLILTSTVNTILIFFIEIGLFAHFSRGPFIFSKSLNLILINTAIISIISFLIWSIFALKHFFLVYKESLLKEEQYKRDIVTYQYEMLKNQVNPHFLFNSLNVLTSLVESNQQTAVVFIRKLAEMYRYILDAKDKELVPLDEELRLAQTYIYMQQSRFGDSLNIKIADMPANKQIVPIALQMLVENAIKHNAISSDRPLSISIYAENGYLICSNNIQKKSTIADSNAIGLKNIKERYQFLTDKPMEYGEDNGMFIVKLPLI